MSLTRDPTYHVRPCQRDTGKSCRDCRQRLEKGGCTFHRSNHCRSLSIPEAAIRCNTVPCPGWPSEYYRQVLWTSTLTWTSTFGTLAARTNKEKHSKDSRLIANERVEKTDGIGGQGFKQKRCRMIRGRRPRSFWAAQQLESTARLRCAFAFLIGRPTATPLPLFASYRGSPFSHQFAQTTTAFNYFLSVSFVSFDFSFRG